MSGLKLLVPEWLTGGPGRFDVRSIKNDLFGGLTAAVVALPLALAFGVASGAGALAGLYGAIATGFFAALFGGTSTQITGPTGPMTVVMGAVIAAHAGSLPEAFTIVMLGGLLQVLFGLLGVGRYVSYTPVSVVSGFMSGVGCIIILVQLLPFLGLPTPPGGVSGVFGALGILDPAALDARAACLAGGALLLVIYWPKRLAGIVPAPLGVLVIGTLAAATLWPDLPVIGPIPSALPSLVPPQLALETFAGLLQPAFILALLGSIDSLLTSLVADSMTKSRHDADRELVGQGFGNLAAGLLGALPGAGATMRTVVNIRAGGRSPLSGIVHSLMLLAFALGLGPLVAFVPHAVLAAILMKVGWDIIDWGYLRRARKAPREKVVVMLVTLGLTVFVDLITAVAVGIILAGFVNSRWLAEEQLKGLKQARHADELDDLSDEERSLLNSVGGRVLVSILQGSFSYASARDLARRDIQATSPVDVVVYDFSQVGYIDPSAAMAIDEMIDLSGRHQRQVMVSGLSNRPLQVLEAFGVLDRVPGTQRFGQRREAIMAAVQYCAALDRQPKAAEPAP